MKEPFLATTALEEFWDKSKPVLFLAEWCRSNRWNTPVEFEEAGTVPCPWTNSDEIEKGYAAIEAASEWLLPLLARRLNEIHGTAFSVRYWRITAGLWLLWYVSVVYDRYRRVDVAFRVHPELSTLGLSFDSFVVPRDTLDFIQHVKGDGYNLQLVTRIMEALGHEMPRKRYSFASERFTSTVPPSLARRLVKHALRIQERFAPVIIKDSYLPSLADEFYVMTRSHGRVAINRAPVDVSSVATDEAMRASLNGIVDAKESDPFRRLLGRVLPADLPKSYLEGYSAIRTAAERHYPAKPKAIFSANAWYFDEPFKHWAAQAADKGVFLAGAQHGGNYGAFHGMLSHEHEIRIADRFYSWGWTGEKVKPFPATKLARVASLPADNRAEGILYTTTSTPRFLLQLQYSESHWLAYIDWQLRFLRAVGPTLRAHLRARPHREDLGWQYVARWRKEHPDLAIETWDVPFAKSIANCRVFVCDHIETTFAEALAANKPTVLFYNPEHRRLKDEAKPHYESLQEAGILHTTPEAAAVALENAYEDVEAWWNSPLRQKARAAFCRRFALTDPRAVDLWAREFRGLASAD
jgi:putative transferase (TIGR04331 family)